MNGQAIAPDADRGEGCRHAVTGSRAGSRRPAAPPAPYYRPCLIVPDRGHARVPGRDRRGPNAIDAAWVGPGRASARPALPSRAAPHIKGRDAGWQSTGGAIRTHAERDRTRCGAAAPNDRPAPDAPPQPPPRRARDRPITPSPARRARLVRGAARPHLRRLRGDRGRPGLRPACRPAARPLRAAPPGAGPRAAAG